MKSISKLLIVFIFSMTLIVSCGERGEGVKIERDQIAVESGGISIAPEQSDELIKNARYLANKYGLTEVRDGDLERRMGAAEHRQLFIARYMKNNLDCLFLSNDISESRFTYMLFSDAFTEEEFYKFKNDFMKVRSDVRPKGDGGN